MAGVDGRKHQRLGDGRVHVVRIDRERTLKRCDGRVGLVRGQ